MPPAKLATLGVDWEALSSCVGCKQWNTTLAPCPWCSVTLEMMHDYNDACPLRSEDDWLEAREMTCVAVMATSQEDLELIEGALGAGRVIQRSIVVGDVPLYKHDRLSPGGDVRFPIVRLTTLQSPARRSPQPA